ncbi:MAG: TonB-dependent receptor [Rhodoferax sp.]
MGRNTTFKRTVFAHAVLLAIAATVSTGAMAQSNATGNIFGQAKAGETVLIESDTGVKRTISPDSSGRFQALSLPTGNYKVTLQNGGTVVSSKNVEVLIGQGSEVSFSTLDAVVVTGQAKKLDVTTANAGNVFTAKELAALPIAPAVASIVQMSPATTRGDYRYGNNAASFGGAGPSENAAFINGYPVTNGLYQVGYSSLPFGAISQAQIITGGYGAEFGRSTGGVINITTKSGSNQWEAGVGATWAPNSMRAKANNIVYPVTGSANTSGTDGRVQNYKAGDVRNEFGVNGFVGGPLIEDKLFLYFAAEKTNVERQTARLSSTSTSNATVGWLEQYSQVPRSLLKLDWNITPDNHLEYTRIDDKSQVEDRYYSFNYTTLQRGSAQNGGAKFTNYASGILGLGATGAALQAAQGASIDILKYTGYFTDSFTGQVVIGQSYTPYVQSPFGYQPGVAPTTAPLDSRADGVNYIPSNPQGFAAAVLRPDAQSTNKALRVDLEFKATEQHTLRAGLDSVHILGVNGTTSSGGNTWNYVRAADLGVSVPNGYNMSPQQGGGLGATCTVAGQAGVGGCYVTKNVQITGSAPTVDQSALYIEDRYQMTKNVLLTLGIRDEAYANKNTSGETFVEQKQQIAPRFAATWDVNGDASLKVFGTAGRYNLPLPANLAVRFAGPSTNIDTAFTYTGVDPVTGAPQGLRQISPGLSANNEFGQEKDVRDLATVDIKSHSQDEFSLGFEKAMGSEYNMGARLTYRKLKSTIDDYSDSRPIVKKLQQMGIDPTYFQNVWAGALFNPGTDNTFNVAISPTERRNIALTAAEIGFPDDLQRDYTAIDLMFEHPLKNGWYGKLMYTWSRDYGNHEGQTKSDNGQADVGFTSTWDFPEINLNSVGRLPNDRTHQIKAYGLYELNSEWAFGGNFLAASGRPISKTCSVPDGLDKDGVGLIQYGSIFYLCPGQGGRAGAGDLPWDIRFDMNLQYKPDSIKGLVFKVDVLNVFNAQVAQAVDEGQNNRLLYTTSPTANMVLSYTDPRSVRLGVQYSKKF